jgi:hypothetical protein
MESIETLVAGEATADEPGLEGDIAMCFLSASQNRWPAEDSVFTVP